MLKEVIGQLRKKSKKRKFNQSIDLIINLKDIDMKKPEGRIQEKIELPHGIGKKIKICVFADGDMAFKAKRSDVDLVLESSDVENIMNDKKRQRQIAKTIDFFISAAPLMSLVGRVFGAILGPRGKMPTPVSPNVNIAQEIKKHRKMILVRARGQPLLQCRIGTIEMTDEELLENIQVVFGRLIVKLKRGTKNLDRVFLKTTMGKPIKINI
jgi:large subunit ribosomal protein L1